MARRNRSGPVIMTLEDHARPRGEPLASQVPAGTGVGASPPGEVVAPQLTPASADALAGELSWFFVGRTEERGRIANWLATADQGLLAVTGPPGCGKSALLGHILLRTGQSAEPRTSARTPARALARGHSAPPGGHVPEPDRWISRQVVGQLVQVFAVPAPPDTANDDERIRALLTPSGLVTNGAGPYRRWAGRVRGTEPLRLLRLLGALPGAGGRSAHGRRRWTASTYRVP